MHAFEAPIFPDLIIFPLSYADGVGGRAPVIGACGGYEGRVLLVEPPRAF